MYFCSSNRSPAMPAAIPARPPITAPIGPPIIAPPTAPNPTPPTRFIKALLKDASEFPYITPASSFPPSAALFKPYNNPPAPIKAVVTLPAWVRRLGNAELSPDTILIIEELIFHAAKNPAIPIAALSILPKRVSINSDQVEMFSVNPSHSFIAWTISLTLFSLNSLRKS